jgi:Enoyl-CoA hydratase/isomerase
MITAGASATPRGIVPKAASTWFLPRLVGHSCAADWLLTGRLFDAEEALAKGLVRSVHPPDELMSAASALGRGIAGNTSAVSVALTRAMLWRAQTLASPYSADRRRPSSRFRLLGQCRAGGLAAGCPVVVSGRDVAPSSAVITRSVFGAVGHDWLVGQLKERCPASLLSVSLHFGIIALYTVRVKLMGRHHADHKAAPCPMRAGPLALAMRVATSGRAGGEVGRPPFVDRGVGSAAAL